MSDNYYQDFTNSGNNNTNPYAQYGKRPSNSNQAQHVNRTNRPRHKKKIKKYPIALLWPLILVYFEAVFTILTNSEAGFMARLMPFLFSLSLGGLVYIICTVSGSELANKIITAVFLGVNAIVFNVAYFIYRMFQIHYDLKTVISGAGDAAGGFGGDIASMVFSVSGLAAIFFLFLPLIAYLAWGWKHDTAKIKSKQIKKRSLITAGVFFVAVFLIARIIVLIAPSLRPIYSNEYNYESAVKNFGLFTGIRLDIMDGWGWLSSEDEFTTNTDIPTIPTLETTPTAVVTQAPEATATPTPRVYGPNVMDIDFNALASNVSGKVKDLDNYVASLTPTMENEYTGLFAGKNLIFMSAEAFSREAVSADLTPTLYRMMTKGINFTDYYQPASAGTTGGEYQNIFGMLPTDGGASVKNTKNHLNYFTMGSILDRLGYNGWAFHNNDYKYYKRNETHNNLGYSNGFMGYGNGIEKFVKKQWPESDDEMFKGTLPMYIDKQPFNVYYMTVSGHGIYPKSSNAMVRKHWDRVQGLSQYNDLVKGYIACNLDLEDGLTYLISELEKAGIADDTVIVITADHFPYGLDDSSSLSQMTNLANLYGYTVKDTWQRDHNALIIWSACLEDRDPIVVDTPTSSLDILPTLCNLFDVDWDSRLLPGRDVFSDATPLVFTREYSWKTDICTYNASSKKVIPATPDTVIPDGYVDSIKTIVRNKINYCKEVLNNDYFRHVFKNYTAPAATPYPVNTGNSSGNNSGGSGTNETTQAGAQTGQQTGQQTQVQNTNTTPTTQAADGNNNQIRLVNGNT